MSGSNRSMIIASIAVCVALIAFVSGFSEIPKIIDADHGSPVTFYYIVHVINMTKVFKLSFGLSFGGTFCAIVWFSCLAIWKILTFYFANPLAVPGHVVAVTIVSGLTMMFLSMWKHGGVIGDAEKDKLFLIGSNLVTSGCGYILGVPLIGAKFRHEGASQINSLKREKSALVRQKNAETNKVRGLIQLIHGLPDPPHIPPEYLP